MESGDKIADGTVSESRIGRYDEYFDPRTFSYTQRKTKPPNKKKPKKKYVITLLRIINHKAQLSRIDIIINSQIIIDILREAYKGAEGLRLDEVPPTADPPLFFYARHLFHERLQEELQKSAPQQEVVDDVSTIMQYIQEDHKATIATFGKLTSQGEITYDLLWTLFPPNCLAYQYHEYTEQGQLLYVRSVEYTVKDNVPRLSFYCANVTNDGNAFGFATIDDIEIETFKGARKIQNLPIFPLEYHANSVSIRERAIERGRRFINMNGPCYHDISGTAMQEVRNADGTVRYTTFRCFGRAMIDPTAHRNFVPDCTFNHRVKEPLDKNTLTEEQLAVCTPVLLGFCFGVKQWGGFAIERLGDVQWNDKAFHSLVLDPKQKTLILALVRQHATSQFDDVIAGKGKGLVGLLAGSPGCGKTLTAEALAEITRRPLCVASAGYLGTELEKVEKNLVMMLDLAKTWNAILLIDEAEVFLHKRTGTEIQRNGLVSIFLRQLEYYQGVLILTTNLPANCDPAFESRIHFSIWYPDLEFDARKIIWKEFLKKATNMEGKDLQFSEVDIDRLAGYKLNGRQIKNVMSNAHSIALDSESPLKLEHIDTVLEIVGNWEKAKKTMMNSY
ncbi:hypothetical protein M422DRAFT_27065 [Sphaerobolus stellatus SS14]|nr:hypothetical protein M422DRAFT_27065 [Sphaerobolus stellatus SS14]